MSETQRERSTAGLHAVWAYLRSAPGTYIWLAMLLASTIFLSHLSPHAQEIFLGNRSTNLHHLQEDPIRVLIASAFWLAGGGWPVYAVAYTVFHAQAERWLGTLRWLAVLLIAHIGATYVSEGVLLWAIRNGHAPQSAVHTLDYGVSYALAGIVAVLAYHLVRPWRWVYIAGVVVFYGVPLLIAQTFTAVGHFTAVLLGFACYPLTRSRSAPWDPAASQLFSRFR
ncbi:hypothetical protein GFY24_25580 [Nocardia sp. SYP-A9097]|uniref:rhomboid-like protein n=1 Tax=Nocardia sp. SYP-A9097 TaxID=2663237 RepID=UPI00129A75F4|nr:rhomboid-like protein [Nocardia sp. SYP-A9097]MRH90769.1 hypothetical protein [Nocardia sp. SYP-A9097]